MLLIVVLGRPILVAGLDLDPEPPDPLATERGADPKKEKAGPTRVASPYPKACLRPAPSPGAGLIAAAPDERTVTVASPLGASGFALQARPPVGFSASGKYLATAGADVWAVDGSRVGIPFERPAKSWAWSPVADCIAAVERGRLVVAQPGKRSSALMDELPVSTFAFSPDGSRIVFSVEADEDAGIWMADLRSGKVKILQSSLGWDLIGWVRGMRPFMLRQGSLRSGKGDGLGFLPSDTVTTCDDDIVLISNDGIALAGISGDPNSLRTDGRFRYSAVACAPGGDLMIAVRNAQGQGGTSMAVLRRDGSFVREVAQQSSIEDAPMWGPTGTGVVFAAEVAGRGAGPLVWFLPEGGTARPTGLGVYRLGERLDALLDWSATPPLGHPTD